MWRGQAEVGKALAAALEHAIQGGQVLAVFDGVLRTPQNLFHGVIGQGFQPQLFDLLELFGIRIGSVILVVIIETKQGEDLVDRLYMRLCNRLASLVSRPSWCR